MSQYLNKRKNNNNKFDKSPENFKINMNSINNLGNINMQRITRRAKTRRNQNAEPEKAEVKSEVKTKEEKPVEQSKEEQKEETKESGPASNPEKDKKKEKGLTSRKRR